MHELPYIEKLYDIVEKNASLEKKSIKSVVVEMSLDLGLVPQSLKAYWHDIRKKNPLLHKATLHLHSIPRACKCLSCHHLNHIAELSQLPCCEKCKSIKLIDRESLLFRIKMIMYLPE